MRRSLTAARGTLAAGAALIMAVALAAVMAPAIATASTPLTSTPLASPSLDPAPPAAIPEPFFAEYRDSCVYAETGGTLYWPDPRSTARLNQLPLAGTLSVRDACSNPRLGRAYAHFVAYAGDRVVAEDVEHVVPAGLTPRPPAHSREFRLVLANQIDRQAITRIDIRMCRAFDGWTPARTCGDTRTYWQPAIIWPPDPTPSPSVS